MNIYKNYRINYIKNMRVYLVDLNEDHEVGEKFSFKDRRRNYWEAIDTEREIAVLTPDTHEISLYNKEDDGSRGNRHTSWNLACQDHFAVINEEGTVLFTSKGYSADDRLNSDSEFYVKFQEFIDNGWTLNSPTVLLSDEDDFIV